MTVAPDGIGTHTHAYTHAHTRRDSNTKAAAYNGSDHVEVSKARV